jgi:hypothetical protein
VTLVAVHQPNFLPWPGWFDKAARADVFVLLDDAQFPKKGGTWSNRVQILVQGRPIWLTVPVVRSYHGVREIREMRIDDAAPWRRKAESTLRAAYGRAPHFERVWPLLDDVLRMPTDVLADLNEHALRALAGELGVDAGRFVRASSLGVRTAATQRLVDLVKAVDGSAYLVGGGAGGYQDDEAFARAGIEVVQQRFEQRPYEQGTGEFVGGLSIVDPLMQCGPRGARALLGERAGT